MFDNRRSAILAGGVLLGFLAAASSLNAAGAGKTKPPPNAPPYTFELLGTLGGNTSWAHGINNWGDVVGQSTTSTGRWAAFLSTVDDDGVRRLYNLNDLLSTTDKALWRLDAAWGINDSGQIAANGWDLMNNVACGFRLTMGSPNLGVEVLEIGVQAINANGDVAGCYDGVAWWATYDPNSGWTMHDMGVPTNTLNAINLQDQACGDAYFPDAKGKYAYRFTPGVGYRNLGFFRSNRGGYSYSFGRDIDDSGQVVGGSSAGGSSTHPFRYTDREGMVDLGTLGGESGEAHGINHSGTMIVGSANTATGPDHLFLYTATKGMMDLEAAIENLPPGWSGLLGGSGGYYRRINDVGQVCGHGGPGNSSVAFLLTPK